MDNDTNESLESVTSRSSFFGKVAVTGAFLATLAGCFNAGGHYPATPEARARIKRVAETQDYKASLSDVEKAHFSPEALDPTKSPAIYQLPPTLDGVIDAAAKNGTFAATGPEVATYNSIKEQNKIINELVKSANVRRAVVNDIKHNVSYNAIVYEPVSKTDLLAIDYNLKKLRTEVEKASYAGRQSLQTKLADDKELQAMLNWNREMLDGKEVDGKMIGGIAQLAIARSDINHHEFFLSTINESELLAGAIRKSTTGADVYANGEKAWQKIMNDPVGGTGGIIDQASPVGEAYGDFGNKKISELYEAIKVNLRKEAAAYGRHSKHEIGQKHYFHAKSILDQAHAINALTDEEVAAAEKYITADLASTVNGNLPDEPSVGICERLWSIFPLWQFYVAYRSAGPAFSKDTATPDSIVQLLEDGAVQRYGAGTGSNVKGSTADDIWDFALSTGSIVVEGGATYFLVKAYNRHKKSSDSGSSGSGSSTPSSGGTDIITPGTGPR